MPTSNQEILDAAEVIMSAGYEVDPYLVRQIYNRDEEKVFTAVVKKAGKLCLAVCTPRLEETLRVIAL